jgi:hypothetical protein
MRAVDSAEKALPTADEVQQEAERLSEVFSAMEKEIYMRELENAYELMQKEGAIPEADSNQNDVGDLDVNAQLERAWNLDMAGIMTARNAVLDSVRCLVFTPWCLALTYLRVDYRILKRTRSTTAPETLRHIAVCAKSSA